MQRPRLLLLTALLASTFLNAQVPAPPAASPSQAPAEAAPRQLPVPGGGAGLDAPPPSQEDALKRAKEHAEEIADLQARRIAQQLSLTSAQYTKVRTILIQRGDELHKAVAAETKDHPMTPQERQLVLQQAQEETQKRIAALLTPAQKQQFDAMMERSRAEHSRRSAIAASRRPVIGTHPGVTTPTPADSAAPGAAPAAATPAVPATAPAPAAPPQSK